MTILTGRMEKHRPRLTGPRLPLQALEFLLWSSGMGCLGNNVVSVLQPGASFLFPGTSLRRCLKCQQQKQT